MVKVCKFYVLKKCNDPNCKFDHIDNICKFHFLGNCKHSNNCKFSHEYKLNESKKFKNTESFEPSHKRADMRIMLGNPYQKYYYRNIYSHDVILVPNLFCNEDDFNIYNELLNEIKQTKKEDEGLWKSWHGDTHLIADDNLNWKNDCKTFCDIIDRLAEYFNMDIQATRLNWYRNSLEWKPFHHDAAAVKPHIAKKQNITVGVSFGGTRDIAFQHANTKVESTFPLINGATYAFGNQVNKDWRHGIPQLPPEEQNDNGRISIIVWGKTNIIE